MLFFYQYAPRFWIDQNVKKQYGQLSQSLIHKAKKKWVCFLQTHFFNQQ